MSVNNEETRSTNFTKFLENIVQKKTILDNSPVQVMIGLTNVCNLHCAFCPYCGFCMKKIKSSEMIPLNGIIKLKEFIRRGGIIIPSGRGEPLAYNKFREFMEICKEVGALQRIQLISNGTLIDRYDAEIFKGVNILSISFDSTKKKEFELLRYGADYDKVLDNIRKVRQQLPGLIMQLNVTVNRLNIDGLVEIYNLARKIGINYVSYGSIYGSSKDKVIQLLLLRESDRYIVETQMDQIRRLNSDSQLCIIDQITWTGYEDGAEYDKEKIFCELSELKNITPYMDPDEMDNCEKENRKVQIEHRVDGIVDFALPYCTNPYCVMIVQPNQDVLPCCAAFGAIDNLETKNIWDVWNCEEYQLLREAMFNYDMLPEYCKQCCAFVRYDHINDYIEQLKSNKRFEYCKLVIPPNYNPPAGLIQDKEIEKRIFEKHIEEVCNKKEDIYQELLEVINVFVKGKEDIFIAQNSDLLQQLENIKTQLDKKEEELLMAKERVEKLENRGESGEGSAYKTNSRLIEKIKNFAHRSKRGGIKNPEAPQIIDNEIERVIPLKFYEFRKEDYRFFLKYMLENIDKFSDGADENLDEDELMEFLTCLLIVIGRNGFKNAERKKKLFYKAEAVGIHLVLAHFYNPIPVLGELKPLKVDYDQQLNLLKFNDNKFWDLLDRFAAFREEVSDIPDSSEKVEYYYKNNAIGGIDAIMYYYMIRYFKPHKLVEVGAGYSTLMAAKACKINANTEFISIEPYPMDFVRNEIEGLNELKVSKLQDIPLSFFEELGENDILFIDSSHVLKAGSDVTYIFSTILPRLQRGVIIHFHDIFIPYEMPDKWMRDELLFWNEQYVLYSMLINAIEEYETIMPNYYLGSNYRERILTYFPHMPEVKIYDDVSYWIRKK